MSETLPALDNLIADLTAQRSEVQAALTAAYITIGAQKIDLETLARGREDDAAKIAALEKEVKFHTDTQDRYYKLNQEHEKTFKQVHSMLDGLPGTMPAITERATNYGSENITNDITTRFASYLASLIAARH